MSPENEVATGSVYGRWANRIASGTVALLCCSVIALLLGGALILGVTSSENGLGGIRFSERMMQPFGLKMTRRRGGFGAKCNGYGAEDDPYFAQHGGEYCGLVEFQTVFDEEQLQGNRFPASVELVAKVFQNEEEAQVYTERYWGIHTHSPLPNSLYSTLNYHDVAPEDDEDEEASNIHILKWIPTSYAVQLLPADTVPTQDLQRMQHMAIWRYGRTFARLVVSHTMTADDMDQQNVMKSFLRFRKLAVDRIDLYVPSDMSLKLRYSVINLFTSIRFAERALIALPGQLFEVLHEAGITIASLFAGSNHTGRTVNMIGSKVSENCSILDPASVDCVSTVTLVPFDVPSVLADDSLVSGQMPASASFMQLLRTIGLVGPIEPGSMEAQSISAFGLGRIWLFLGLFLGLLSVSVVMDPKISSPIADRNLWESATSYATQ